MNADNDTRNIGFGDDGKATNNNLVALRIGPTPELASEVLAFDSVHNLDRPLGDVPALRPILPLARARDIGPTVNTGEPSCTPDSSIATFSTIMFPSLSQSAIRDIS
jgi:hypothetical protein